MLSLQWLLITMRYSHLLNHPALDCIITLWTWINSQVFSVILNLLLWKITSIRIRFYINVSSYLLFLVIIIPTEHCLYMPFTRWKHKQKKSEQLKNKQVYTKDVSLGSSVSSLSQDVYLEYTLMLILTFKYTCDIQYLVITTSYFVSSYHSICICYSLEYLVSH